MFEAATKRAQRGMLREWRLHMLSVFSLAVAFVCLGASLLVVTNLRALEERWSRAGRASVYLKDQASQEEVESLRGAIGRVNGVTHVRYVSSGQARSEFNQADVGGRRELVGLPVEAFPASLEVDIRPDMSDGELTDMVGKLRQLPVIDDVETYQAWTERLGHLVRGGVLASLLLAVVVFASVLAVVGSTIRLALQRRKTEVEVMRLVGATDRFIKGPFLLEGTFQGVVGAACAMVLLAAVFFTVKSKLDVEFVSLLGVEPTFLPWQVALGLLATGGVLGLGAAFLGLRRLVSV